MAQEVTEKMDECRVLVSALSSEQWDSHWLDGIDPLKLIALAEKSKVLSPFAWFIFQKGYDKDFKDNKARSLLRSALLLNERDRNVAKDRLDSLAPQFQRENIPFLLLKGLSLAGSKPRDMGDMDLLIKPDDLETSIAILESQGFVYTGAERGYHKKRGEAGNWEKLLKWSNQFEFLHRESGLLIELHTDFFHRYRLYRFNLDPLLDKIDSFWERAVLSSELNCLILSAEDRLLLLSIHNSIKRTAARKNFAFRNILDMKLILEKESLDWEMLFQIADETETLVFLIYSLEMTEMFFPGLVPTAMIEQANSRFSGRKKLLKSIMRRCYAGLDSSNHFFMFLYDYWLPFAMKSRLRHKISSLCLLPVIYPEPHRLRQIYGLPKGSPLVVITYLLEPARWIRYLVKKGKKSFG